MKDMCPICHLIVWQRLKAHGLVISVNGQAYHKICLINFKLECGEDYLRQKAP